MQRQIIEQLLPAIYQEPEPGTPLDAILAVAVALPAPVDDLLSHLDQLFDPRRAPEKMLPFLAQWVDVDRFLVTDSGTGHRTVMPTGMGHLRELCARAAELSRERGTLNGLLRFLEVATGVRGFQVIENRDFDGGKKPFHLRLIAPEKTRPWEALLHAIVMYEKPAYVTYNPSELQYE